MRRLLRGRAGAGRPLPAHTYRNPVLDVPGTDHGDPFVLETPEGFVLYHTGANGVPAYTSPDLVDWRAVGPVLGPGGPGHWAQADLWAPEVVVRDGVHLMVVAATSRTPDGRADDDARRLGLARSAGPLGPFTWDDEPLLPTWAIDGHVHRDPADGDWLFCSVRDATTRYRDGSPGCGTAVDRLLRPDLLSGDAVTALAPDARWEGDRGGTWYWNEGPWVTRRQGRLVQMYSGGWFADDTYGVGVASAPHPRGPWTKDPANPLLRSGRRLRGPGHNSLVVGPDLFSWYAVYHAHRDGQRRRVALVERLRWLGTRFVLGEHERPPSRPGEGPHPRPAPAVHDPLVPHWRRRVWLSGGPAALGGTALVPSGSGLHRLEVTWGAGRLAVEVDGRPVPLPDDRPDRPPALQLPAGRVLRDTTSSGLLDEPLRVLPPGSRRSWTWGGRGPVEASLSVQGEAVVRLGDVVRTVDAPELVALRLHAAGGAEALTVEARGPVELGDVELVARPPDDRPPATR